MSMFADVAERIQSAKYQIALTGAGISKESNVPTFRGEDGLWRNYNAMDLATPSAFSRNPGLVWEWYSWRQGLISTCNPNLAHIILSEWERNGLIKTVITQNVDGLHHKAGSMRVLEVHGDLWAVKCINCDYKSRLSKPADGILECPECGQALRPDVVWFGESLDPSVMNEVYSELSKSDLCLIVGTSGIVQPAASFPLVVKQNNGILIEINVERTPLTSFVDVHLEGKAGEILPAIDSYLD
jgi:NAD-dependent deacetylase